MSNEILDQASPPADAAKKSQRGTRWLFWLQWVLVNAVGWAFLAWAQGQSPDGPLGTAVLGLGFVCMVLGQWLVLQPRLARAGWWLLVTPVGLASGGVAALLAIYAASEYYGQGLAVLGLLATLLMGTPVGFLQWLVLRRQMRRALWWLPLTIVAVGTGLLALWLCLMVLAELPVAVIESAAGAIGGAESLSALAGALVGAVYGAITGAALAVLLPHPAQTQGRKPLRSRLVVGIALLSLLVICLAWGILTEPVNGRHLLIQHWLGRRDFYGIHLQGADLSGANLVDVFMPKADLAGANLTDANLTDAWLDSTDLSGADLTDANLTSAWLYEADLSGANLTGADLTSASLGGANLTNANLSGADLSESSLSRANLSGATMPDGTVHE